MKSKRVSLKKQLQNAVSDEEYENAAVIRDCMIKRNRLYKNIYGESADIWGK